MKTFGLTVVLSLFLVTALPANSADNDTELRGPDAFSDIEDDTERARAMFGEAGKVIQHPRCVNCHPKGDSPRQGMAMELHEPPVRRGPANFGVTGMRCFTCHNPENVAAGRVPGNPAWHLAPKSQAWYGKSLGEICEQIKDTERNGGMSMDELVEHMAEDSLVGWGWEPGGDREPVPGDWETFGNLIAAWADAGAHCPAPEMAGAARSEASINPLILASRWRGEGRRVALATVIRTWGASPRPVGSMLVADDQGDFAGSVSGGCIESEVVMAAAEAIAANASRILDFGIDNDDAWSAGLTCGGSLQVLVQPVADDAACLSPAIVERCAEALTRREPLGLLTNLVSMRPRLVEWVDAETLPDEFRNRLTSGRAGLESREQADWFIQPLRPAPTLAIVGAVHVAQPLARMAAIAGLDVVVIDPRRAFADSDNLRGIDVRGEWPGEALAGLVGGGGIAVATLTHEPRLDDPALNWALTNDDVFYIGALGSRRTHAARLERLREQGFDADQLARIHAPIGLDIKALTPEEIAVSILAELVAVRRGARD